VLSIGTKMVYREPIH